VTGSHKIAARLLEGGRHRIRIVRGASPSVPLQVLGANGASVEVAESSYRRLAFAVGGAGLTRVKLQAGRLRDVRVDGRQVAVRQGEWPYTHWIELLLSPSRPQKVFAETE
jgi:hypothetical protein